MTTLSSAGRGGRSHNVAGGCGDTPRGCGDTPGAWDCLDVLRHVTPSVHGDTKHLDVFPDVGLSWTFREIIGVSSQPVYW